MCRCSFWRVRPLSINGISQSVCLYFEPSWSVSQVCQYFQSVSRVVYVFVQRQVGTVMSLSVSVVSGFVVLETMSQVVSLRKWRVLCWNVRGLNAEVRKRAVFNKISESECDIVCLQET